MLDRKTYKREQRRKMQKMKRSEKGASPIRMSGVPRLVGQSKAFGI